MPNGRSSTGAVGKVAVRPGLSFDYRQVKINNLFSKESRIHQVPLFNGSLSTREKLQRCEADELLHSVPKLRMCAATPSRPHTSLWHAE
jgi:hypothetical protein